MATTTERKKTPWKHNLNDLTKRPETNFFTDVIREKEPRFEPPGGSVDMEENRQILKSLARHAYEVNPYALVSMTLSDQLRLLSEQLAAPKNRSNFLKESTDWCVLHLVNRYYTRDLNRGDGERTSDAVSSNCLEWWDPGKGGWMSHAQNYFSRTLRPQFLEEQLERRKNEGAQFYSLDAAKDIGFEPSVSGKGISIGRMVSNGFDNPELNGPRGELDQDNAAFDAYDRNIQPYERGDVQNEPDSKGEDSEDASEDFTEDPENGEKSEQQDPKTKTPIQLLRSWVDRNQPELAEGLSRGDRASKLQNLRSTCRAILGRMATPGSEQLLPDQASDAEALLEDFDSWDPRRVPWTAQYPEVVDYLEKEDRVAAVKEKLEAEAAVNSAGFLFPTWEVNDRLGENRTVVQPLAEIPQLSGNEPARAIDIHRESNRQMAALLGVELPKEVDPGSVDVSRALALHWADSVLTPSPRADADTADLIDDYRKHVCKNALTYPFDAKHGMAGLLSRSVNAMLDDRDLDLDESQNVMCALADHMQKSTDERVWLTNDKSKMTLRLPSSGRTEY